MPNYNIIYCFFQSIIYLFLTGKWYNFDNNSNLLKFAVQENNLELVKFICENSPKEIVEMSFYNASPYELINKEPKSLFLSPIYHSANLNQTNNEILKYFFDKSLYFDDVTKLIIDKNEKAISKLPFVLFYECDQLLMHIFRNNITDEFYHLNPKKYNFACVIQFLVNNNTIFSAHNQIFLYTLLTFMNENNFLKLHFKESDESDKQISILPFIYKAEFHKTSSLKTIKFIFNSFSIDKIFLDSANALFISTFIFKTYIIIKNEIEAYRATYNDSRVDRSKINKIICTEINRLKIIKSIILNLLNPEKNSFFNESYQMLLVHYNILIKDFINEIKLNLDTITNNITISHLIIQLIKLTSINYSDKIDFIDLATKKLLQHNSFENSSEVIARFHTLWRETLIIKDKYYSKFDEFLTEIHEKIKDLPDFQFICDIHDISKVTWKDKIMIYHTTPLIANDKETAKKYVVSKLRHYQTIVESLDSSDDSSEISIISEDELKTETKSVETPSDRHQSVGSAFDFSGGAGAGSGSASGRRDSRSSESEDETDTTKTTILKATPSTTAEKHLMVEVFSHVDTKNIAEDYIQTNDEKLLGSSAEVQSDHC